MGASGTPKASRKFAKKLPGAIAARREHASVATKIKQRKERGDAREGGADGGEDRGPVLERHSAIPASAKLPATQPGAKPSKGAKGLARLSVDQFMERGFFEALEEASTDEDEAKEMRKRKHAAPLEQESAGKPTAANGRAPRRAPLVANEEDGMDSEEDEGSDDDASVIENSSEEEGEAVTDDAELRALVRQVQSAQRSMDDDDDDDEEADEEEEEGEDEDEAEGSGEECGSSADEDGQGSGDEEASEEDGRSAPSKPAPAGAAPSRKKGHAAQLEALKSRDPEFYRYLQQNDQTLLRFGEGEEGDEEEDEEDEEEEEEDASDSEEDGKAGAAAAAKGKAQAAGAARGRPAAEPQPLTAAMVSEWRVALVEQRSVRALRLLVSAFRTAVRIGDDGASAAGGKGGKDEAEAGARNGKAGAKGKGGRAADRFVIVHAEVFNDVLRLALEQVHLTLDAHLLPADADAEAGGAAKRRKRAAGGGGGGGEGRMADVSASARWPKLSALTKAYLSLCLELLGKMSAPEMSIALLAQLGRLLPYYRAFPLLRKRLLRALLDVWAQAASTDARLAAFGVISRVASAFPAPALELCLKGCYLAFARNCKLSSRRGLPAVCLMTSCLVELYGRDADLAYQHAFLYLRQLAVHVRSALNAKKAAAKRAHDAVYNWQVVNCLRAWAAIVCAHGRAANSQLRLLAFPLVQTALALARLLPATRYVPLRFQCVRLLNEVGRCLELHIPLTADLFEVLDKAELGRRPTAMAAGKPVDWTCTLKVAKGVVGSRAFQDGMVGRMLLHLSEWLAINSVTISFPEMAVPVLAELQRACRSAKVARFHRQMKNLIATVRKSSALLLEERAKANFAPKDLDRVREFEKAFAARGETPLQQLVREEKRAAEVRDAQFGNGVVGESDESDDDEDASDEEGGARPSRKQRRAAGSDEDDDDSEGEGAPSKRADQGKGKGKAKGKAKGKRDVDAQAAAPVRARLVNPGSEDVVREFDAREFFS